MRKKLVVGNWKMNLMVAEARSLTSALAALTTGGTTVEIGLCPTFLSISAAVEAAAGSPIGIGSQDVFFKDSGAFTGFLSAPMLRDAGCKYTLIGHSERRGKFGKLEVPETTIGFFAETDETVNLKLKSSLAHGLVPIVCCGETLAEREAGSTDAVIKAQITGALSGISESDLTSLVIAYEPVWAIGTGKVCDSSEANRVCAFIRSLLPAAIQADTRVLYGGSVNPGNAAELFAQSDIDGGLVGGASLKTPDFVAVIRAADPEEAGQ